MKEIFAEIITIGDEILYGQITDTNSQWISAELDKIGIKTKRKTSVSDNKEEIIAALNEAQKRVDIVLITGGLGPTKDDLTKKILADYFNMDLKLHEQALSEVKDYFHKRGRELTDTNWGQALLPESCQHITNSQGTAPGMWFEEYDTIFISMPGVPFEMKAMMSNTILDKLKEVFELPVIYHKMIRTVGIGESWLADKIADWEDNLPGHIKLAYLPGMWQVRLRLTGVGADMNVLKSEVDAEFEKIKPSINSYIFGYGSTELQESVGAMLKSADKTIAFAESCTGGYLSHLITQVAGSSEYYLGSIVAYQDKVKESSLGVQGKVLKQHGAVSEETVKSMAEGVRTRIGSDIGFAVTGIAGPGGGTDEKPVGTVWLAFSDKNKNIAWKIQLGGTRELNIKYTAINALNFIRQSI